MYGGMRVGIPWNGQMAISIVVMMITLLVFEGLSKSLDCTLIIISVLEITTHFINRLKVIEVLNYFTQKPLCSVFSTHLLPAPFF